MADRTLPPEPPSSSHDRPDPDLERRLATLALLPVPPRPDLTDRTASADPSGAPVHPIDLDLDLEPIGAGSRPAAPSRRRLLVGLAAAVVLVLAGAALLALDRRDGSTVAGPAPSEEVPDLAGRTFWSTSVTEAGVPVTFDALAPSGLVEVHLAFEAGLVRASAFCDAITAPYQVVGNRLIVDEGEVVDSSVRTMGSCATDASRFAWLRDLVTAEPTLALEGDRLTVTAGETVVELLDRSVTDPDRPLEGTMWELDATIDGGTTSSAFAEPGEARPFLQLLGQSGAGLRFLGDNGCQGVTGTVEVDGDAFRVIETMTNMNACFTGLDAADAYAAVLGADATFAIDGSRLTITNGDRALVFTGSDLVMATTSTVPGEVATSSPTTMSGLDRMDAVVATAWELESVVEGSVRTSAEPQGPGGRRALLSFTVDPSASTVVVTGNDGCNDFGGMAVVRETSIGFTSMGRNDVGCQGGIGAAAETMVQVLVGETTYALDGGLLTISQDDRSLTFRPAGER